MATTKTAAKQDMVEIFVPKGYANDEPNLLICVNGVNYLLPRGETATVPAFIAEEFNRSQRAATMQDKSKKKLLEAAK